MIECPIAGFRYHDGPDILRYLHVGDDVELIAEPDNPHDPWAVRVEHRGSRIGYVPRSHNESVATLLRQGVPLKGRITEVDPAAPPWEAVAVRISQAQV